MELFRLLGTIAIDNSGADNAIESTTGKAQKSEGKISSAFKKIGSAVVAAFAVDKIVAFGEYGYDEHSANMCGGLMLSFTAFGKN